MSWPSFAGARGVAVALGRFALATVLFVAHGLFTIALGIALCVATLVFLEPPRAEVRWPSLRSRDGSDDDEASS